MYLCWDEPIDELTKLLANTSAQAVTRVRRYIQDTTQEPSVICNVPVDKRADGTPSDYNSLTAAPGGSADCLENKCGGVDVGVNSEFITKLNPHRLFALSSEEMRLYIRQHQGQRPSPAAVDFIFQ